MQLRAQLGELTADFNRSKSENINLQAEVVKVCNKWIVFRTPVKL